MSPTRVPGLLEVIMCVMGKGGAMKGLCEGKYKVRESQVQDR